MTVLPLKTDSCTRKHPFIQPGKVLSPGAPGRSGLCALCTPVLPSSRPRDSAGVGVGRGEAQAACTLASFASPGCQRRTRGRRRPPLHKPGHASTGAPRRLSGCAGPSRPHGPPASRGAREEGGGPRAPVEAAPGGRLLWCERCLQAPTGSGSKGRARDSVAPHSPWAAAAAASPWPGQSSLAERILLLLVLLFLLVLLSCGGHRCDASHSPRGSGRCGSGGSRGPASARAAAATRARESAAEPARGCRLRRDDRGAAGADPRRSLQRRGGPSSHPRHWATAPPGPHVQLRRGDCGGRAGHERQGTRRSAAWGWRGPARPAPPAGGGPPLTTLPGSRKPAAPTNPGRSPPSSDLSPCPGSPEDVAANKFTDC
ncbi:collagen alpha-1(I) chain-like [Cavia porcellus]|uniref:collagen alpha-1(I) chain-like n=1 Tax=Cavia porcellus TaxID=10141 RepID=UPI002FE1EED7